MKTSISLTVVVCTFNRPRSLKKILLTLLSLPGRQGVHFLVVDNSDCQDAIVENQNIVQNLEDVKLITSEPGKLSVARNKALRECISSHIAFIDDDAVPCNEWLRELRAAFHTGNSTIAAVGGPIIPVWLGDRPKWLSDNLLEPLTILDLGSTSYILNPDKYIFGANMAFTTESLRQVGGFNTSLGRFGENILLSNEESEIQDKLRGNGLNIFYNSQAYVYHDVPNSRLKQEWFYRRMIWQAISETLQDSKVSDETLNSSIQYLEKLADNLKLGSFDKHYFSKTEDPKVFEDRVFFVYNLLKILMNTQLLDSEE